MMCDSSSDSTRRRAEGYPLNAETAGAIVITIGVSLILFGILDRARLRRERKRRIDASVEEVPTRIAVASRGSFGTPQCRPRWKGPRGTRRRSRHD